MNSKTNNFFGDVVFRFLLHLLVKNMSQIRDKKAHRKRIATMNLINAKSVQLTRAARSCLLFIICFLIGII